MLPHQSVIEDAQWQEPPARQRGGDAACAADRPPVARHLQHMHRHAVADLDAQLVVAGVALADEVLRTADEVREGVPFVEVLACSQSGGVSAQQRCDLQEVTMHALTCSRGSWQLSHLLRPQVKTAIAGDLAPVTRLLAPAHGLLTVLIPEAAQLSTPPRVRDGKGEAPVQQADADGGEIWIVADFVARIPVGQAA